MAELIIKAGLGGTTIRAERDISIEDRELYPILKGHSSDKTGFTTELKIDMIQLRRIIHEWILFKKARRMVEIDVLDLFSKSPYNTLAANEIKKEIKAGEASIHKALNNLVKKGLLVKPGKGTYRRNFSV